MLLITRVGGVVRLRETELYDKVSERIRTVSTIDVSIEVMDYYITDWYSVEIIHTVTHVVQTVFGQGFTKIM